MISILNGLITTSLRISSVALLVFAPSVFTSIGFSALSSFELEPSSLMGLCGAGECPLGERMVHQSNAFMADYVPPHCDDSDADQTNNCGPRDSGDAGTHWVV